MVTGNRRHNTCRLYSQVAYVANTFDDVDTTVDYCWSHAWTGQYPDWSGVTWLLGGDVNADGDPSDEYVGIMAANETWVNGIWFFIDDVAIAIY